MKLAWGKKTIVVCLFIGALSFKSVAQQTTADLQNDIESLKQGQAAILDELRQIKSLLPKTQTTAMEPQKASVHGYEIEVASNSLLGNNAAKIVMVEFSDYQCSFCARFAQETFPEIREKYVKTGKLSYVVMNMPLSVHKLAANAAEAAYCARDQGKYWEMRSQLISKQESLDKLSSMAILLGLDSIQFEQCLRKNMHAEEIAKEKLLARKLGIIGVPAFILAERKSDSVAKIVGISAISGAQPFAVFQKEIEAAISLVSQKRDSQSNRFNDALGN